MRVQTPSRWHLWLDQADEFRLSGQIHGDEAIEIVARAIQPGFKCLEITGAKVKKNGTPGLNDRTLRVSSEEFQADETVPEAVRKTVKRLQDLQDQFIRDVLGAVL